MRRFIVLTILAAALSGPAPAAGQEPTPLTVTGRGRVEARPDRAEVSYTLNALGATREAARAAFATQARSLLGRLRAIGVDPLGIRLSNVQVARRSPRPRLRSPFAATGAIAARTDRVDLAGRPPDLRDAARARTRRPVVDLVADAPASG